MPKLLALCLLIPFGALAQVSNGSDGALNIPANAGTVIFDPLSPSSLLDTDADNVFHFTTITIGSGTTLKLKSSKLRRNTAVLFLASGDVNLANGAILDLSGEDGVLPLLPVQISRRPAEPGPGGFAGGLGQRSDTTPISSATNGFGPAGSAGVIGTSGCAVVPASHAQSLHMNLAAIPLVGGAGGAGLACLTQGGFGGNGGAGGGAIRIVSASQIVMADNARILANGGSPSNGFDTSPSSRYGQSAGYGGGGMIHLMAPVISIGTNTLIRATPLSVTSPTPLFNGQGVIRFNSNTLNNNGLLAYPSPVTGPFYTLPIPDGVPEVTITQVNSIPVASPPAGQVTGADVVINAAGSSTLTIAAKFVPVGTLVNLRINSDTVVDQSLTCAPLAGVLASSTATCTATFPLGANIAIAAASW